MKVENCGRGIISLWCPGALDVWKKEKEEEKEKQLSLSRGPLSKQKFPFGIKILSLSIFNAHSFSSFFGPPSPGMPCFCPVRLRISVGFEPLGGREWDSWDGVKEETEGREKSSVEMGLSLWKKVTRTARERICSIFKVTDWKLRGRRVEAGLSPFTTYLVNIFLKTIVLFKDRIL